MRVVCGPDLLAGSGALSGSRVWADVEEAAVSEADVWGYTGGEGGGC